VGFILLHLHFKHFAELMMPTWFFFAEKVDQRL